MSEPLLRVENLTTHFHTDDGTVRAVDGISFDVDRGETVCLVGESGSGKSVTVESLTRLIDAPPGEIVEGTVEFDGIDLTSASAKQLREIRGDRIGYVFQNPQGALNPVYTVGWQIMETIHLHEDVPKAEARERAIDLLDRVGIPDPSVRVDDYPHEFSGGMKQRVIIAMALATSPDLLIADEPTTALDVTIQAQILRLLEDLQAEFGMSILLITHDLGVVAEVADRVVVMYAGKVMEEGDVYEIFEEPAHPYTLALLECLPGRGEPMSAIGGTLPDPMNPPEGCRFHPRCPFAVEECKRGDQPPLLPAGGDGHNASCVYYGEGYDPAEIRAERVAAGDPVADGGGADGGGGGTGTGDGEERGRESAGEETRAGGGEARRDGDAGGDGA